MSRLLCACLFLAACATSYGPMAWSGGYSDLQLGDNIFRVTFEGNSYLTPARASEYALLRSADVALEKGFRYFIVSESTTANIVPGSSGGASAGSKPTVINTILCYRTRPSDAGALVYDASAVKNGIQAKYQAEEQATTKRSAPAVAVKCQHDDECSMGSCIAGLCR